MSTRLLAHRPFAFYWFSRMGATLAGQMVAVGVGWQMYDITGSALALGIVGLVQFAPAVLFLFLTGPVADRVPRRLILTVTKCIDGAAALILAVATLSGWTSREVLLGFVFIIGAARAFDMPASQAILPSLVREEELSRAVAFTSSAHQIATIAGPALGGLLYAFGPEVVYGLAGAMYLTAALLVSFVQVTITRAAPLAIDAQYLLAGIRFIRGHPVVLGAMSLDLFAVMLGGATALLPIYAKDILATGPWGLGLLRSSPAIGALTMALVLSRRPLQRRVGRTLFIGVAAFGLATLVFAFSTNLAVSMLALAALGAADTISVVVRMSLVQLETPDAMRGRVNAVNSVFIGASNQIGEFESGLLAALFGAVPSAAIGGVGTLLIVVLWMRLFPALANRDRMTSKPQNDETA